MDRGGSRFRLQLRLLGRWLLWALTTGGVLVWWVLTVDASRTVSAAVEEETTSRGRVTSIVERDDATVTTVTTGDLTYQLDDWPALWSWGDVGRFLTADATYSLDQQVEVVVDNDYRTAYDVSRYRDFSWTAALTGLVFSSGLVVTLRRIFGRSMLLPDGARWQRWRTRQVTTATVLEVRERRIHPALRTAESVERFLADHDHQPHHLVVEIDGQVYLWKAKSTHPTRIEPGQTFEVMGRARPRGWIASVTDPMLYPAARLD